MGSEAYRHQIVVAIGVAKRQSLLKVVSAVAAPGRLDINDGEGELCAQARLLEGLSCYIRKEILIAGSGDATHDHFGNRDFGAIHYECLVHPFIFERPDFVV